MEEFIENIRMLTNTLGHKVFEEIGGDLNKKAPKEFTIKAARGADARGVPTTGGFVVLKDSKIAMITAPSCPQHYKKTREKLMQEGILKEDNDSLIFAEDFEFSSPSTAASIVLGRSANGLLEWKLKDGTTLKEFESGGQ